ncbi:MAG: DUF2752 domain-containing protein [Kiritimatiellia bacterium]
MRVVFQRLRHRRADWELVFGVLFLPLLLLAAFVVVSAAPELVPKCPLHAEYGVVCPACGLYRSLDAFVSGGLAEAFARQPLGAALVVAGIAYSLYSFVVVLGRLPRVRVRVREGTGRVWLMSATALALANWLYLVLRGV